MVIPKSYGVPFPALKSRKQPRTPERFLMQVSAVHDPLLTDLASVENLSPRGVRVTPRRSWELGSHVHAKSRAVELTGEGASGYCQAVNAKTFGWAELPNSKKNGSYARSEPATSKQ